MVMQETLTPEGLNDLDAHETAAFKAYCLHEHFIYRQVLPPFLHGITGNDRLCYDRNSACCQQALHEPIQKYDLPSKNRRFN